MWQRELWYRIKPTGLFANPEEVNRRVLDVCGVLGEQCGGRCPREALGVIASPRGFMSGAVSLLLPDSEQLLPLDSVVYPIPGDPEECGALVFAAGSLARCVLVVEKESVFRCAHTCAPQPLTARAAQACQPAPSASVLGIPEAQGNLPQGAQSCPHTAEVAPYAWPPYGLRGTAGLPTPRRRRPDATAALPAPHRVRLPRLRVTRGAPASGRRTRCARASSAAAKVGPRE